MSEKKERQLKALNAKKETLFRRMQQLYEASRKVSTETDLNNFRIRYKSLEQTKQDFEKVIDDIMQVSLEMDGEFSPNFAVLDSVDELYCHIQAVAEKVNKPERPQTAPNDTVSSKSLSRLPNIELPSFSGNIKEWPVFYECFKNLIHDNKDLTPVDKVHFLIGKLSDSALTVCSGIPPIGDNYDVIWSALVEKYQDKRQLASSYLQTILEFKVISTESLLSLNSFVETFDASVAALKKVGITDLFDFTLSYIALSKLNPETRDCFEMFRQDKTALPTYSEIISFIKSRTKILNTSGKSLSVLSKPGSSKPEIKSKNKFTHSFVVNKTDSNKKCVLCHKTDHGINRCSRFLKCSPQERYELVKTHRLCLNCLSTHRIVDCKSKINCSTCHRRHHSLLHFESSVVPPIDNDSALTDNTTANPIPSGSTHSLCSTNSSKFKGATTVLLSTVSVNVLDRYSQVHKIRCLLDSASQANFITYKSAKRLNLVVQNFHTSVVGIGLVSNQVKAKTNFVIASRLNSNKKYSVDALVIEKITDQLPNFPIQSEFLTHLANLPLADDHFNKPGEIDCILGAEIFSLVLEHRKITGDPCTPIALETSLGFVVMGNVPVMQPSRNVQTFCNTLEPSLEKLLKNFWEIEEIPEPSILNKEDSECENIFVSTHTRDSQGRYTVALPFKSSPSNLGDSYSIAYRRFLNLEKKLDSSIDLRNSYNEIMQDYLIQNHMSKVSNSDFSTPSYYIPHHCIFKSDSASTPVRVVFDASSKTDSSFSLNDLLYTGPKLQSDVFTMLLNFRLFEFALTADIRQMYRQINLCPEHRKYQRILWRFSSNEPLLTYQLNTVTFGIKSSPFLALRTVHQLADDGSENFPTASKVVARDMYMDDYVASVSNLSEAKHLVNEMIHLFNAGGFSLVKWSSNSSELLLDIPENIQASHIKQFETDYVKILGLQWHPQLDVLTFQVNVVQDICSKRNILSTIARIFDPLGILSAVILYAKLLIKELWCLKLDWDELPPLHIVNMWSQYRKELPLLANFQISRHLGISKNSIITLVGFADASQKAYAAVLYVKVVTDHEVRISLVCAKSKVSPLKIVSIPRLELCAAYLLAKMLHFVINIYSQQIHIGNVFAFTDSNIVLNWICAPPHKWKTFVANRVAKIQELVSPSHWYHISGTENPADRVSRGLTPAQFLNDFTWVSGPTWLNLEETCWPIESVSESDLVDDERQVAAFTNLNNSDTDSLYNALIFQRSSWLKMLHIVVYVFRFCKILPINNLILAPDLIKAEEYLVKLIQSRHFAIEINLLESGKECSCPLRKLRPFLKDGILRVGGRLRNSQLDFDQQHPILLPKNDHFVSLLIDYYHQKNLHTGPHLVLALLRQRYWILSARGIVRKRIQACNLCFRFRPKPTYPLMADLPSCRVQQAKAFALTGVDYAGPVTITLGRRRGAATQKAYICLFICLVTKALHLELVSDLSTANFIQALKRFLSRRGPCAVIYSDCGTNFIGSKNILGELYNLINSRDYKLQFAKELTFRKIEWKFNPPSAPHFGGIWEANVKSMKTHLYKIIGSQILSYEEFVTFLVQIEALLNSRPLCVLSSDPAEPLALTPAHFLNLTPLQNLPTPDLTKEPLNRLSRFQLIDRMVQDYWRRWHVEYLTTLQTRNRWNKTTEPIKPGTVVVVKYDGIPPMQWPLGIIEETFPNKDGVIRVVAVKTKTGLFKRPVVKVCPLPTQ